jgi:hypothetical protein
MKSDGDYMASEGALRSGNWAPMDLSGIHMDLETAPVDSLAGPGEMRCQVLRPDLTIDPGRREVEVEALDLSGQDVEPVMVLAAASLRSAP